MRRAIVIACVAIGLVAGLAGAGHAQFTTYDTFDSGIIDREKWSGFASEGTFASPSAEFIRRIEGGRLRLSLVSYGGTTSDTGTISARPGLNIKQLGVPGGAGSITGIKAQVTVLAAKAQECIGNPDGTSNRVELGAGFFNDGASTGAGDRTGDISVYLIVRNDSNFNNGNQIHAGLLRCPNASCSPIDSLVNVVFTTTWALNTPVALKLLWQRDEGKFRFAANGEVKDIVYPADITEVSPPVLDRKQLLVQNFVENCTDGRKRARLDALIDNVEVRRHVAPPIGPGDTTVGVNVGVGRSGSGTLTVDGGSVLTTTHVGGGIIVGGTNPTSGQGVVNIDGAGSLIETTGQGGFVNVGNFGTASTADLNITNGGVLRTTFLNWPRGDFLGGNAGTSNVIVDGVGSAIHLSGNDAAGGAAGGVNRDGGTGTFTLRNGAVVTVSAPGATTGGGPGFTIGRDAGGSGTMNVESGASLTITGNALGAGFLLGRNAGGVGTLNVRPSASVTINSILAGGGFTIGQAGTGTLDIDGGTVLQDGQASTASPGITIGEDTTGNGTLTIRNGGSLTIDRRRAAGGMTVGRLGSGTLSITGGGRFILNDTSAEGMSGIIFGGNGDVPTGGPFSALVSGPGSTLTVSGIHTNITVGRNSGSSGTLTVSDGATLNVDTMTIARGAGSNATVNVTGIGTTVNLVGEAAGTLGGGFSLGAAGVGAVNVTGGAVMSIDASAVSSLSGASVGGSPVLGGGGTGALTVSGAGSQLSMVGSSVLLRLGLDISGGAAPTTGIMTVASGGQAIVDPAGKSSVGNTTGSTGSLIVTGVGSLLDAGAFLGIGRDTDDNPGGTGIATVAAGGTIKATGIHIGAGGTLNGSGGTIVGNVVNMGGAVNPGESPGRLTIIGSYESLGGKLVVEVDANGNHDVLTVVGTATFDSATAIEIKIDPGFQPTASMSFDVVRIKSTPQGPAQRLLGLNVPAGGGSSTLVGSLTSLVTTVSVEPVPSAPLVVAVDIQPGLAPNVLNAQSQGGLPVAIMGSPAFSVMEIDASSITLFAPTVALAATADPPLCQVVDVDGDQIVDLLCYLERGGSEIPGDAMPVLEALTTRGIAVQGSDVITVVDRTPMLSGLSPAKVWIGLKNSDAIGLRLDVLTEVHLGPTKVGQGRVDNVPAGGSGFNNALPHMIPLSLAIGPVPFASGTQLKLTVSARRTCFGGGHSSGTPRFWYNGRALDSGAQRDAGTRFDATIDDDESDYFLRGALTLSPLPGSARLFVDKAVDSKQPCSDRKFIPFGTWTIAP